MTYDLIIIGAGAAGLFAAANAPVGWNTLALEKADAAGRKLLLSGSGQCNLTNNEPIKSFLDRYGENGKRLRPVLFPFSNIALMEYFEDSGLPLAVREDGKVFPASMKSTDVLEHLLGLAYKRGVEFRYGVGVTELGAGAQGAQGDGSPVFSMFTECVELKEHRGTVPLCTKRVLVASGGESYPQTGSDGSFFACLERLGLELVPRRPALVPIFVEGYPYADLSGLTFSNVEMMLDDRFVEGSLLFMHKGFSGPAILGLSRYVTLGDKLTINYLPGKTADVLRSELIQAASGDLRQIVTILEAVASVESAASLPRSFLERVCESCGVSKNEKASRLSGREMGVLAEKLTADSFEISGTGGFDVAMVTAGGVDLDEINLKSMEAKRYPGLYFAGEVLDIDGDTGGYNLQFAFSSAKRAIEAMRG